MTEQKDIIKDLKQELREFAQIVAQMRTAMMAEHKLRYSHDGEARMKAHHELIRITGIVDSRVSRILEEYELD